MHLARVMGSFHSQTVRCIVHSSMVRRGMLVASRRRVSRAMHRESKLFDSTTRLIRQRIRHADPDPSPRYSEKRALSRDRVYCVGNVRNGRSIGSVINYKIRSHAAPHVSPSPTASRDSQASVFERRHPANVYRERRVNEHNGIRARPFNGDNNRQCARLALSPSPPFRLCNTQRVCMHARARTRMTR